ncbi:zinc-ribbon domain-containing protein [Microbacterium sp.]|uniref:zinc-ribbon domain-containing protein n=1 Tax=Microbacterium sp. TaxID=51671 RepID=UPI00351CCF9B
MLEGTRGRQPSRVDREGLAARTAVRTASSGSRRTPQPDRHHAIPVGQADRSDARQLFERYASNEMGPREVLPHSGRRVAWQCAAGRRWEAAVYSRSAGRGCPHCSGRYRRQQ